MSNLRSIKRRLARPRNPLVAPALQRKAGSHHKNTKQQRQQAKRATRRALAGQE